MNDLRVSVSYGRKLNDGEFGTESFSVSITGRLEDGEDTARSCRDVARVAQSEVLGFLASHAGHWRVAQRARVEAGSLGLDVPPDARDRKDPRNAELGAALNGAVHHDSPSHGTPANAGVDLEDLPF